MRRLPLLLLLAACGSPSAEPDPTWPHYADKLGEPVQGLDAETAAAYERGFEVMSRDFTPAMGLGPSFNADSCHSCHGVPLPGGAAPRYRDFFLVKQPRWDGTLVDAGTNGVSPVRNFYAVDGEGHIVHRAEPIGTAVFGRRNAPPMFGVGLFEFVEDKHIISREDPDDLDGDGISGRANYEQGRVGRFGYKAQASGMESFNRGAMLNQIGLTSNPLFFDFPEAPLQTASLDLHDLRDLRDLVAPTAWAQVSAPGEPTTDDDGVADPELSNGDQLDLLIFSTYLAPPRPTARTPETRDGARLFDKIGCTGCHVPALESRIGPLPAYTDLLLHDLGPDNADNIGPGFATGSEFRTAPLWGVALTAPYLHDGSADTLDDAIRAHGGEGEAARDAYQDLSDDKRALVVGFLESLGPYVPERNGLDIPKGNLIDRNEQPGVDDVGVAGGPMRALDGEDRAAWLRGQALYDRSATLDDGLGARFNADSCRACHQDPVLGGSGGVDTNVMRFGGLDDDGNYVALEHGVLPRAVVPGEHPLRLPDAAAVIESRSPLTTLGVGLLNVAFTDERLFELQDPEDLDGDGISGRVHVLSDGRVGRYGWKAQIPSLTDFAADALLQEIGLTVPSATSTFTVEDDGDDWSDPEQPDSVASDITAYMSLLAPPPRKPADDAAQADRGEQLFGDVGCASCHLPDVDGVAAYTDLLLHDVAPVWAPLVEQDPGVLPTEFRTPPLWGVSDTGPWLHGGTAFTLDAAITVGHFGEATAAREAYQGLSEADRAALIAFLRTL